MNKFNARKTVFAKKSFGQNFLVDQNYVRKIIAAFDPKVDETVIEIGPGRGALTEVLIASGADIIAIELERGMIAVLRQKFERQINFKLVEADALTFDFSELIKPAILTVKPKLVANLPFNISTAILQKLIEQRDCFSEMVLMFQREVVTRITARAGNSERGFLTVLTEAYLECEKLFDVPPKAFLPAPQVWSAVVRLKPKIDAELENEKLFRQIVSAGFRQKRKTITNNLKSEFENVGQVLDECGIERQRRAETLMLEEWICLTKQKADSEI
jgi:16S rRNA (adenine1518-N6/adenine1519-N6)-dimethyltransferase